MFDGIAVFFKAIKEKCSNDEEYAAEILKARGFLLEDTGLVLSDNSDRDDASYLNKLLTADNLGKVEGDKIFINPSANVEKIFYSKLIGGCESCPPIGRTWKRFLHESFDPKVPVFLLEPFVARYVKAISACGVETYGSCDGNHHDEHQRERYISRILVEIAGEPNSIWHEIICKRLLVKRFKLKWLFGRDSLKIPFDKKDKWRKYLEFNRAGEFLYNNRIKIRQIRRAASDGITVSMARHLSSEELAKIFSERANKLFDDFVL